MDLSSKILLPRDASRYWSLVQANVAFNDGCSSVLRRGVLVGRVDHYELSSLWLVPDGAALLVHDAAAIDRDAPWRHAVHHRTHDGGGHRDGRRDGGSSGDGVVIVVPAAATVMIRFHVHVHRRWRRQAA